MSTDGWRIIEAPGIDGAPPGMAGVGERPAREGARPAVDLVTLAVGGIALTLGAAAVAIVLLGPTPSIALGGATGGIDAEPLVAAVGEPSTGSGGDAGREMLVDVGGAVLTPGLYRLSSGARVGDAIQAAGGYSARVDVAGVERELNLAARLADGDRIRVPSRDDAGDAAGGADATGVRGGSAAAGLVDLNRATAAELDALPGIGPVTAGKIVAAREERPFTSVDELLERRVVGAATLAKFRDLVTVR